jgi:hypothetical protein
LLQGFNYSDQYHSTESLFSLLLGLSRDMEQALGRLSEKAIPKIRENYEVWEPLYEDWVRHEKTASEELGHRYHGLWCETAALESLDKFLRSGKFDRFLGPSLKFRYRQPHVLHCHLYLFARAMEFLEPPDERKAPPPPRPVSENIVGRHRPPLDDPAPSLLGRIPQEDSIKLSRVMSERTTEFAFLKSLAAMDSLLKVDENGAPIGNALTTDSWSAVGQSLIDAPVYEQEIEEVTNRTARETPVPTPSPSRAQEPQSRGDLSRFAKSRPLPELDDEDPITVLENRLGLR